MEEEIRRLISAERNYVDCLLRLNRKFVRPLLSRLDLIAGISENASVAVFLSAIEQVTLIHRKLLPELERWSSRETHEDGRGVGFVFLGFVGLFYFYGHYFSSYWDAMPLLRAIPESMFKAPEEAAETPLAEDGAVTMVKTKELDQLSIEPVKRLLTYKRQIRVMLGLAGEGSKDKRDLAAVLDNLHTLTENIEDLLLPTSSPRRPYPMASSKLISRTVGQSWFNAIVPGKSVVHQGIVRLFPMIHAERRLVLFDDCLLLVRVTMLGYAVDRLINVTPKSFVRKYPQVESKDNDPEDSSALNYIRFMSKKNDENLLELCAPTAFSRNEWLSQIRSQIRSLRAKAGMKPRRKRIKPMSSESKGRSLSKDDVGCLKAADEPVVLPEWVPDSFSDSCMRCKMRFNFFRRKHHCRTCGWVVCHACSFHFRVVPRCQFSIPIRLCHVCIQLADSIPDFSWIGTALPYNDGNEVDSKEESESSGSDDCVDCGVSAPSTPSPGLQGDFFVGKLQDVDSGLKNVIVEIILSERSYVRSLIILLEVFVLPLQALCMHEQSFEVMNPRLAPSGGEDVLLKFRGRLKLSAHLSVFLHNVGQIYTLNCEMLQELEKCLISRESSATRHFVGIDISEIFIRYGPLFRLYGQYAKYHQTSLDELHGNVDIKNFIEIRSISEIERLRGQTLPSFLIMPIQRVPRYELLLKSLLASSRSEEETIRIRKALEIVTSSLTYIDEAINWHKEQLQLLELERRFTIPKEVNFHLVVPWRKLILEGSLGKFDRKGGVKPYFFHLLNDVLIQSNESRGSFSLLRVFELSEIAIESLPSSTDSKFQHCFAFRSSVESFVLLFPSLETKESWISSIKKCISESKTDRLSFASFSDLKEEEDVRDAAAELTRSLKQGKGSFLETLHSGASLSLDLSSRAQDFAPLWMPDQLQTCCALCTKTFNMFRRRHHCRICGRVICGDCSMGKILIKRGRRRLCDSCFSKLEDDGDVQIVKEGRVLSRPSVDSLVSTSIASARDSRFTSEFKLDEDEEGESEAIPSGIEIMVGSDNENENKTAEPDQREISSALLQELRKRVRKRELEISGRVQIVPSGSPDTKGSPTPKRRVHAKSPASSGLLKLTQSVDTTSLRRELEIALKRRQP